MKQEKKELNSLPSKRHFLAINQNSELFPFTTKAEAQMKAVELSGKRQTRYVIYEAVEEVYFAADEIFIDTLVESEFF